MKNFKDYTKYLQDAIHSVDEKQIESLINVLYQAYTEEKMVFVIGNGGSAANASHFAQDLAKGARPGIDHPKRIRALSLTDNIAFISALGNDDGYETIFEQQLRTYAKPVTPIVKRLLLFAHSMALIILGLFPEPLIAIRMSPCFAYVRNCCSKRFHRRFSNQLVAL